METERGKQYRLYKANKSNNGSAMQLDLNAEREAVFLECAGQVAEQRFDWQNKITLKLSVTDIGKILAVFSGRAAEAKLFHDPGKGDYGEQAVRNRVVELRRMERGFGLKVSEQAKDGKLMAISVPISDDEAEVIATLLRQAVVRIYGW